MAARQPAVEEDRSGRHEQGHDADAVIGLAAADHDEDEHDDGGDPDRSPGRRGLREQHPDPAGEAHGEEEQPAGQPERRHDLGTVVGGVPADERGHRDLGPCMRRLPDEVGGPEQEGDPDRRPRPPRTRDVPAAGENESHRQPRTQEEERVLVLQADPGPHAQREPEAPISAREELHQQPQEIAQASRSTSPVVSRCPAAR